MSGEVEQLRYTWAPRGVEGVNRFQIAGMSAGFKGGEAVGALSLARTLCRYDPPRGNDQERPISYGWADQGPYRIAFQRIALPAGTDRAGNFAAHLLVGTPETLPAAKIASAFGSPLWWHGITPEERAEIAEGKRDFELRAVELEEFVATAPEPNCDEEATMALLYGLLRLPAAEQLALSAVGGALGSTLSSVARLLPEALADLTVSTYEAKAIYPFRLLGTLAPSQQMHDCELHLPESLGEEEERALRKLTAVGPASEELRHIVSRAGRCTDDQAPARMWETALLLVGLENGRKSGTTVDEGLLADPEVASYLSRTVEGRSALATWAQNGGGAILRAIKNAGKVMEAACREALYAAMGDRFAAAADLRGSAAAVAAMAPGPARQAVLDQLLEAAKEERVASTLGAEDVVTMLSRAGQLGIESTAIRPLLRGSVRHMGRCAAERSIPDAYIATMFGAALANTSASAAEAVRMRPGFLAVVSIDGAEAESCVDLLARLDLRTRETALGTLLPQLMNGRAQGRTRRLLMSMPPDAAGQAIVAARSRGLASSDPVDELCHQLAAILLSQKKSGLARRLLADSRSEDSRLATALLRRLTNGHREGPLRIAVEAQAIRRPELRRAVRRLALDDALATLRSLGGVEALWEAFQKIFPEEDVEARLKRLLGVGAMEPPPRAVAVILAWVSGSFLDRHKELLSKLGSLKDRDAEAAALALAASIEPWHLEEVAPFIKKASKRTRKWWRRIEDQSANAQARPYEGPRRAAPRWR